MVLPYLNDHHNMTFIEVLLIKGEKIVIPAVLRGDMLTYMTSPMTEICWHHEWHWTNGQEMWRML